MGFVLRAFLAGIAICVGLTAGDIISDEMKDRYNGIKKKRENKDPEVLTPGNE